MKENDISVHLYRFFRQEVKREIKLAEKERVRSEILKSNGNSNSIWKILNRCLPKKNAPLAAVENPLLLANKFNEFYANVGKVTALKDTNLAKEHNLNIRGTEGIHPCESIRSSGQNNTTLFTFRSITTGDVQRIIRSLPSNKAPGCDKVNAKILKDSSPVIAPILTSLINDSFSLGSFPLQWKKAEIVPILKSGDSEEPANTRPISLLPILSKVCERAAHSQLVNFLDSSNIIHQMQSGNRKFHSTETSLLYFTDELLNNMDHRKMSVIVLLDMSKAFDSIRHDLMLRKLRNVGLSELACAWFESYLSQRQQVVKIQDTLSSPLPLTVGVPQGSILGPVLFALYVNDLLRVPKHCKPMGYVDDTKIFLGFPSNKLQDVISAVNEDLKEIVSWCCRNSLLINPDKTKLLYVGVPQLMRTLPATLPSATILGTEIKPVTVTKDLGVHIDCYLNFNEHITKTASDCMFKLTRVNRIKHLLDRSTLIYLIKAFVFCKLFYCSTVWSNTSNDNIKKLQLVQNYACRIVTGLKKYDHITEALKSLKWLNVKKKLLFNDLVMVYKCINNLTPNYLCERFKQRSEIHQRDTRQKSELTLPKCRIAAGQRAFAVRGAKSFNFLPKFIRDTESLSGFKRRTFKNIFNS